ncbi:MAG: Na+/H+ antiporter NhaA, partial [Pseudomonadota bacterium]
MNNSVSRRQTHLLELTSGLLLLVFALAAMIASNSALSGWYDAFLSTPLTISLGQMQISKPLYLWINDGLMVL